MLERFLERGSWFHYSLDVVMMNSVYEREPQLSPEKYECQRVWDWEGGTVSTVQYSQLGLYIIYGNVLLFSEPTPHPILFQLLSWHIQHQRADAKGKSPSLAELHSQPSWHVLCGVSQSHSAGVQLCSSPCNPIPQIDLQCSNLCHTHAGPAYVFTALVLKSGEKKTFYTTMKCVSHTWNNFLLLLIVFKNLISAKRLSSSMTPPKSWSGQRLYPKPCTHMPSMPW